MGNWKSKKVEVRRRKYQLHNFYFLPSNFYFLIPYFYFPTSDSYFLLPTSTFCQPVLQLLVLPFGDLDIRYLRRADAQFVALDE